MNFSDRKILGVFTFALILCLVDTLLNMGADQTEQKLKNLKQC